MKTRGRFSLVMVLVAGAACGLEPEPLPPPIAPGAPLAYVSRGLGPFDDIFLLSADGQVDSNLTNHLAFDSWPTWSPDGQSLAFESDRGDGTTVGIFRLTVGVTGSTLLSADEAYQTGQPAWSPVGNRIAFASDRDSAGLDIYMMDPDGANVVRLTTDAQSSSQPAWAPSGAQLAFASDRSGNAEIWVMDTLGGNLVNLSSNAASDLAPAWSPDGQKIAFMSNRDTPDYAIWVMNANGSSPIRVSAGDPPCELPQWTPDGTRIAFDCDSDVFVVDADGTNLQRITRTDNRQRSETMPRWRP